ncbi:MAG TPA: phosphoribosyltransferase family protein [Fimbriimonadaceae bacterium]|nr:phosphoribosyltransferase family protein [Fimbriimonadaceae bacterium]
MTLVRFRDRADAGRQLAMKLLRFLGTRSVVYGIARGGVVVAAEVAKDIGAELDVVVVRKLGHPGSPEYACGAITAGGDLAVKQDGDGVSEEWLESETQREVLEAMRREALYLEGREPVPCKGRTAIVIDDGIATGMTVEVALLAIRRLEPARIVVATPVTTPAAVRRFSELADEVVAVQIPEHLHAVGQAYEDFSQVKDEEVLACLNASRV